MRIVFWLLLAGFLAVVAATIVLARRLGRTDKALDAAAITEYRVDNGLQLGDGEPDVDDDLDAKWSTFWYERELDRRNTPLWAWLHEDEEAIGREVDEIFAAALDHTQEMVAVRAAAAVDEGVKPFGYAGIVDMYAQWIYKRHRSVDRMVAILKKVKGWPPEWQRQLDILLAEDAVGRAQREVRARRARGEVWAR